MNALKETKKKHLLAILKYLYLHNSSTMNELVGNLQLSQPSIRNMVRILQEKQLIQEVEMTYQVVEDVQHVLP